MTAISIRKKKNDFRPKYKTKGAETNTETDQADPVVGSADCFGDLNCRNF